MFLKPDQIALAARLAAYRADPVRFVVEAIGATPEPYQADILRALAKPGARVSVRSGHGVGKSTTLAWAVLWFVCLHADCRIPCTAPSSHQLFDVLWAEIAKWRSKLNTLFAADLAQTSDSLTVRSDPRGRFAVARTARSDQPEALQGFHATNVLYVVDEASGVADEVYATAEGALSTEGSRIILMGNPTRNSGYFYDSHHADRARWSTFCISSSDSRRVSADYADSVAAKYGRDSNYYRVRVLGEFPTQSDDTLISLDWLEASKNRDIVLPQGARRIAGLDVARFGDDSSALAIRQGPVLASLTEWRGSDLMQTVGRVAEAYRAKTPGFEVVYVDAIGMGAGVVDRLNELRIPAVAVNVAESSAMSDRFNKLRDELWWAARDWFAAKSCRIAAGVSLADDLIGEMAGVRYKLTSAGKIKIEGKDEMKKRGQQSPNLADAVCLTFGAGSASVAHNPATRLADLSGLEVGFANDYPI